MIRRRDLDRVIDVALDPDPTKRYHTGRQFIADLECVLASPSRS